MTRQRNVLLEYLTALAGADSPLLVGEVTAIDVGASVDGVDLVTVDWLGTETYATYLASYTPVVGHVVAMVRTQPLLILGRIVGTPPSS